MNAPGARHTHVLAGCRPAPLASYLRALGTLRLVAEQADPSATGHWSATGFVLRTAFSESDLVDFFLDRYVPSPVASPWNGGSGYGGKDDPAKHPIGLVESSGTARLAPYRQVIAVARRLAARAAASGWDKPTLVTMCRAEFPDEAVPWLDASIVLTGDGASFPPLLGTGGNDGRLEFSRNYMQQLGEALCLRSGRKAPTREDSCAWLRDALWDAQSSRRPVSGATGQFDPSATGGPNSAGTGAAPAVANPWAFVLAVEGTLLLSAGPARRLGVLGSARHGRAAFPFTFDATAVGYGSAADGEASRGEFWAPVWSRPAAAGELASLMAEGRMEWNRHQARSALDAVRAAASLGADRGIRAFHRYGFAERNGLAYFAVPLGTVEARVRPRVTLLGTLDPWLEQLRRAGDIPAGPGSELRRVDRQIFTAASGDRSEDYLELLVALARLERSLLRSPRLRDDRNLRPLTGLKASEWLEALTPVASASPNPELRLAVAITSQYDRVGRATVTPRHLFGCVTLERGATRVAWADPVLVPGLTQRATVDVLADALVRRALQKGAERIGGGEQPGIPTAYEHGVPARTGDLVALARGGQLDGTPGLKLLRDRLGLRDETPLAPRDLSRAVFSLDPMCLLHGVFFADKELPGQPKVLRAITAFVEAYGIARAHSGGVKRELVRHSIDEGSPGSKEGYGSIPFHRTEYVAEEITAFATVDLGQIRAYGLGEAPTELLHTIALWELRALLDDGLRLRTACDLEPAAGGGAGTCDVADDAGQALPDRAALEDRIRTLVPEVADLVGDGEPLTLTWALEKGKKGT